MARPQKETPRMSRLVPALIAFAREKGLDHALIAARLGIAQGAEADLLGEECAATTALIEDLFVEISAGLGEPHLALRLPADLPKKRYELPELAARSSPDALSALGHIAKYISLVHASIDGAVEQNAEDARLVLRTLAHPRGVGRHAGEYALAYALTNLRASCGENIAVTRVWFSHARPPDLTLLHLFFGTRDLSFGAQDSGFAISREILDKKSPAFDPRLLATVEELAENVLAKMPRDPAIAALLSARLLTLLPNDANIEAAARAMHMSARTLQRRLEFSGANFSEVLDNVRREEAIRCLAHEDLSLGEITHRLGFSDLATFSRAFKRWTGKPPGAFRSLSKKINA